MRLKGTVLGRVYCLKEDIPTSLFMSSIANSYFAANGIVGLVKENDISVNRVQDIPTSHTNDTLWRCSVNRILNPTANAPLARYRFCSWNNLTADIAPGVGCVGRSVAITVAWGSSAFPPADQSGIAQLPGSQTFRFGGLQDPSLVSHRVSMPMDTGEFSLIVRPQSAYGYPVLFIWVQYAAGTNALAGALLKVTFKGSLEAWTTPVFV
jgi:hypothetical protein